MLSPLKALANDGDIWKTLFQNKLSRTLALRRRFPGPMIIDEVSWIATDAAPQAIGASDWRDRTYIRAGAGEIMKDYADADGRQAGIADKEPMGLAIGSVAVFSAQPDTVLFVGVDNLNAVCRIVKGGPRRKFAAPSSFGVRSKESMSRSSISGANRIVASDEIARSEERLAGMRKGGMASRARLPMLRIEFRNFGPHLDWGRQGEQIPQ